MKDTQKSLALLIHDDGPGGGPLAVMTHARYLREDFGLTVIHGGHGRLARFCEEMEIPHIRLPLQRPRQWLRGLPALIRFLRRFPPDLLILFGQWGGALGALAGRLAGVRHMVYVAEWSAFYTDWDLVRVIRNHLCERVACRLADRVVCLSESNRYQYLYRQLAPEDRLIVIPNPVPDLDRLAQLSPQEIRQELGWDDGLCHVVSVGRLSDQKRVDWLLASWAIVRENVPLARLWIVGDGEEAGRLQQMAATLGLGESCVFVGAQPNGTEYLAAADVVAVTSMYETFGYVVVEAMACGRPVVASRVDGIRDSLRDGCEGLLVAPGDVQAFAHALIKLARNPVLREKMGTAGRERARVFAAATVMPAYRQLFVDVIEGKSANHSCLRWETR
ncbi:MAG: glycosyltransferase [Kiritimatiellae bacterium]|nr:glycosyltransferase [Kiritimatiellia bacterium]